MLQIWHDLLFAHWPIAPRVMRQRVPPEMPLDTFDGQCWIGIVPFYMSHVRPRWVPPLAGLLRFPELNVRTYVTLDSKPGVYFFSLDTVYQSVVWAAHTFYHLPYWQAQMQVDVSEDKVAYSSRRNLGAAQLSAFCRPATPLVACQPRQPGALAHGTILLLYPASWPDLSRGNSPRPVSAAKCGGGIRKKYHGHCGRHRASRLPATARLLAPERSVDLASNSVAVTAALPCDLPQNAVISILPAYGKWS
jgi:hypothetical protein